MKIYTKKQFEAQQNAMQIVIDDTGFITACEYFRQICGEIGELIGNSEFKGGYDDMPIFYAHESYKTDKGVQLAIAWAGVNDLCKYEASKLGIGSPDWWYRCWEDKSNSSSNGGGVTNPEPLYYNIQVSVDKDYIYDKSNNTYNLYKDSPEVLYRTTDTDYPHSWGRQNSSYPLKFGIVYRGFIGDEVTVFYIDEYVLFDICEGQYPLPNIVTIEHNGVNFTFTPIPVYE